MFENIIMWSVQTVRFSTLKLRCNSEPHLSLYNLFKKLVNYGVKNGSDNK